MSLDLCLSDKYASWALLFETVFSVKVVAWHGAVYCTNNSTG